MNTLLSNLGWAIAALSLLWLFSLWYRDASLVDRFWSLGFIGVAGLGIAQTETLHTRQLLVFALLIVWGLRLSLYLTWRNWGTGEDTRYQAMRRSMPKHFPWVSLFWVFWLQAVLMWIVALPVQVLMQTDAPIAWRGLDAVGLAVWALGFFFEAVGDYQLSRFLRDPNNKGKVMNQGLWRFTRHPNYFGDALLWWGLFLLSGAAVGAWWTIIGPIVMTLLLMKVSGVAMLERTIHKRRPQYETYKRQTNAFFPWFPKGS